MTVKVIASTTLKKDIKKELGSGYKTATKLLAGIKILLFFHFLSSLVTFFFNVLKIKKLSVTTRCIDSDDQMLVVTVFVYYYALYHIVTSLFTATTNVPYSPCHNIVKIPFIPRH